MPLMEALAIPRCTAGEGLLYGLYSADGQTEGNTAQKAGNRFAAATERKTANCRIHYGLQAKMKYGHSTVNVFGISIVGFTVFYGHSINFFYAL